MTYQSLPFPSNGSWRHEPGEVQRLRIISAMLQVACERGEESTSVARVLARSGVSRRTFYDFFADRHDCALAAFDHSVEQAAARVIPAFEAESQKLDAIRAGLFALLCFFDDERELGWMCVVESLAGGPALLARRKQLLQRLATLLDASWAPPRNHAPPLTAEGVVGGVLAVLHARLLDASATPLTELLNPLMGMIVLPYLGHAAASRERARGASDPSSPKRTRPAAAPLDGLNLRLTYRTVRALNAIADDPGSSNREVAAAAGITDQGQISKLLRRLEGLGLVRNDGQGQVAGMANAWTITPKGQVLIRTLRAKSQL